MATKGVSGTVTANLYDVTLPQALDAILASNGLVYRERANFIYVYTPAELAALDRLARPMAPPAVFQLCYVGVGDVLAMVKPLLSPDGSVTGTRESAKGIDTSGASGGSTAGGGGDTGGNSYAGRDLLVVTDYAENVERVRRLLAEVDRRPQQVLVEATIMAATLSDQNSLGIDLSFLGGVDFNSLLSGGGTAGGLLNSGVLNGTTAAGTSTNGPFAAKGYAGFSSGGGGLQVGVLHKNLGVFINALESVSNTTILANPKVLALDKQSAKVHVGSSFGVPDDDGHADDQHADGAVHRDRDDPQLSPVRRQRRPRPHGDPPRGLHRRAERQQPAVHDHDRDHDQRGREGRQHDRDRRAVPRADRPRPRAGAAAGEHPVLGRAVPRPDGHQQPAGDHHPVDAAHHQR